MDNVVKSLLCLASVAVVAAGCCARRQTTAPQSWAPPTLKRIVAPLSPESTPAGSIQFDVKNVPSLQSLAAKLQGETAAGTYLRLTPQECIARAAAVAPAGELLEWEEEAARQVSERGPADMRRLAALQRRLLALRRQERQSQAALEALLRFYQLADAELQLRTVEQSVEAVQQIIAAAIRIEKVTGNQVAQRRNADVQALELRDREAVLRRQIEALNDQLRTLLQMADDDARRIAPIVDETVWTDPVDLAAAVVTAQTQRVELESLRLTMDQLSDVTLPAVRTVLGREEQALGTIAVPASARNTPYATYEVQVRAEQLSTAIIAAEHRIAMEVRAAAAAVDAASLHIARAKEIWHLRSDDLRLLQLREKVDSPSFFIVVETRIAVVKAEAQMQHEIIEQLTALARLHAVCGDLLSDAPPVPPLELQN